MMILWSYNCHFDQIFDIHGGEKGVRSATFALRLYTDFSLRLFWGSAIFSWMNVSQSTSNRAIIGIILISIAATGFLLWLLYGRQAPPQFSSSFTFLPALNAVFNALSAIALCIGLSLIRRRNWRAHRVAMITAFVFSSLFLVSYIAHHALHGDLHFGGSGPIRTFYLVVLASHVLLSVVALPFVLITFFFSLTGRFQQHKRLARITFPIWLYVSVTGVVVYAMLSTRPG